MQEQDIWHSQANLHLRSNSNSTTHLLDSAFHRSYRALQLAEETVRSNKLAEKLAAARHASSSSPVYTQLAGAEEAKRKAEQHAENMRQVWNRA